MDRRRGAKIAYVKEIRSVKSRELPSALGSGSAPSVVKAAAPPEHWYRKKYKKREQLLEKQKNSPWRLNDRRANKNGFHHDVYWITGDLYRGNWKLNHKEGSGIHSYCSGNRYEGDWKTNKREGYGTFYIPEDGKFRVVYKGHWKAGRLHGAGYLHCAFGETYEGEFENGMRSGLGRQTYWCPKSRSYDEYVGGWELDKREGVGRLTMVNGDVYQGCFSDDKKHGQGVYSYRSSTCKFQGLWKDDVAVSGTYVKLNEFDLAPLPRLESCVSSSDSDYLLA